MADYEQMAQELGSKLTPQIAEAGKDMLGAGIQELYEKAKGTANEWDDLGVKALAAVLGVELTEPAPAADAAPETPAAEAPAAEV
ncbi:MAG: hypothetical protein C4525_02980 [Desulfarculus sp.]|nr:MAG: hypothetical protein C4525_02980 [Desulfarculus sp.]